METAIKECIASIDIRIDDLSGQLLLLPKKNVTLTHAKNWKAEHCRDGRLRLRFYITERWTFKQDAIFSTKFTFSKLKEPDDGGEEGGKKGTRLVVDPAQREQREEDEKLGTIKGRKRRLRRELKEAKREKRRLEECLREVRGESRGNGNDGSGDTGSDDGSDDSSDDETGGSLRVHLGNGHRGQKRRSGQNHHGSQDGDRDDTQLQNEQ